MAVSTYLIKSEKDRSYYVGISEDPKKRLREHNGGKVKTTTHKKPYQLVYFKEHNDYEEARRHEKWLKKKNREYKMKLENVFFAALAQR